jgi:hypothetical protein
VRVFYSPGDGNGPTETAMPLRIRVQPGAADELLVYLRRLGADARKESATAVIVRSAHAPQPGEPADQDEIELEFVVRAWAAGRRGLNYEIERAA